MIRTALPFGYLLIALLLLAGIIAGVAIFALGWRWRSRSLKRAGWRLCAAIVVLVIADISYDSAMEWNPSIDADAQIVGTWRDGSQTINLAADHTFVRQTMTRKIRGAWTRDDYNLRLQNSADLGRMRFVQFRGAYHLMTDVPDDPDAWNGDLGFWQAQDSLAP